jgi:hypothetical protein
MKLFMFYVGGDCGGSNIELHDIRFSVGETPEDCHDDLRRQWWGTPESLHLDCWGAVEHADGYHVALTTTAPSEQPGKLFSSTSEDMTDENSVNSIATYF